jgi:hypothetical protein
LPTFHHDCAGAIATAATRSTDEAARSQYLDLKHLDPE